MILLADKQQRLRLRNSRPDATTVRPSPDPSLSRGPQDNSYSIIRPLPCTCPATTCHWLRPGLHVPVVRCNHERASAAPHAPMLY